MSMTVISDTLCGVQHMEVCLLLKQHLARYALERSNILPGLLHCCAYLLAKTLQSMLASITMLHTQDLPVANSWGAAANDADAADELPQQSSPRALHHNLAGPEAYDAQNADDAEGC